MSSPVVGPYLFFSFPAGPLTPPGRPKNPWKFGFFALFADFYAFQKMTRNLSWKMRPKNAKIMDFGVPKPSKIGQKSVLHRPCQKVVIFNKKYEKKFIFQNADPWFCRHGQCFVSFFTKSLSRLPRNFDSKKTLKNLWKTTPKPA